MCIRDRYADGRTALGIDPEKVGNRVQSFRYMIKTGISGHKYAYTVLVLRAYTRTSIYGRSGYLKKVEKEKESCMDLLYHLQDICRRKYSCFFSGRTIKLGLAQSLKLYPFYTRSVHKTTALVVALGSELIYLIF